MKILFPIKSFYPAQSGGPSNTIYWHSKELAKQEVIPYVVTSDNDIIDNTIVRNKWIYKYNFPTFYSTNRSNKFAFNLTYNAIKKIKSVDIVHLNSLFYPPNFIILLAGLLLKKTIICSVRGELESFALSQGNKTLKKFIIFLYTRISSYIYFHGTSESELKNISLAFPKHRDSFCLMNYMDLPNIIKIEKEKQFLFIGRINRIKAIHKIIEGVFLSKKFRSQGFKLVIAGTGDKKYLGYLNTLIKKYNLEGCVKILGRRVEGTDKQKLFAQSYFTLLLSETENFGNVVIESMSQATPVITSIGTPWSILNELNIGYHVSNSPQGIAQTFDNAIELEEFEYNIRSEKSLKYVYDQFDIKKNIVNWLNIYKNLS